MGGTYVNGSVWFYAPNKAVPVIWAAIFYGSGFMHYRQCMRYKSWKMTGLLVFSAMVFTTGYILREVGAFNYGNLNILIASTCLVYAAPPFYELTNYLVLSRILYYVPYHSPIHPGRVVTTFVGLSGLVESLNGPGIALSVNSSNPESLQNIGKSLMKASLLLQLAIICFFMSLAICFHRRCYNAKLLPPNLKSVLTTLYCSSFLILIRTIYRTVEYFEVASLHVEPGLDPNTSVGVIIRYEWYFWVFEAMLMLMNSIMLNDRHPGKYLPSNNKIYLAEDGVTEVEGPGYEDSRPFWVTFIDPFDVVGLLQGRDKKQTYWKDQNAVLETSQRNEPAGQA